MDNRLCVMPQIDPEYIKELFLKYPEGSDEFFLRAVMLHYKGQVNPMITEVEIKEYRKNYV